MSKNRNNGNYRKGSRVKLTSDFTNGHRKVVAKADQEGVVVGRQNGSDCFEVKIEGLSHSIFPPRDMLVKGWKILPPYRLAKLTGFFIPAENLARG